MVEQGGANSRGGESECLIFEINREKEVKGKALIN